MNFSHFFVDRPIFASVLSIVLLHRRRHRLHAASGLAISRDRAADHRRAPPSIRAPTPRRSRQPSRRRSSRRSTASRTCSTCPPIRRATARCSSPSPSSSAPISTRRRCWCRTASRSPSRGCPRRCAGRASPPSKSSPDLMMVIHMLSPDDTYDQLYVSNYARSRVRDVLLRLDGVGNLIIFGEREYSLRIWLDPEKLSALGMTSGDIVQALREQNVQVSGGSIGAPPNDTATRLPVHRHHAGPLRRRARLPLCHRQVDRRRPPDHAAGRGAHRTRRQGLRHQFLSQRQAGGGARHLPAAGHQRARGGRGDQGDRSPSSPRIFRRASPTSIVYNPTEFISESINEVYKTILEAIALVVIVIIVFLQSWRMAIVPIVAIPVSLIGTLAVLYGLGFSLNMLTLFGLVLAIGIVVDDAIVVVENVERNIRLGYSPPAAAHRTMDEVGTAIIAISLVLIAVFVPTAFIPGITGQFYLQFAITIAVATAISALNSLTLSPALAALLFKPHDGACRADRASGRRASAAPSPTASTGASSAWPTAMRGSSASSSAHGRRCLSCSPCSARCIYATVHMIQTVPTGFIPTLDQGYAIVVVQLPDGASLSQNRQGHPAGLRDHPEHAGREGRGRLRRLLRRHLHQRQQCRRDLCRFRLVRGEARGRPFGRPDHRHAVRLDAGHPGSVHHRRAAAAGAAVSAIPAASRCSSRSATAPTCGRS